MGTSLNGDRFMTPRLSPLGGDYCTCYSNTSVWHLSLENQKGANTIDYVSNNTLLALKCYQLWNNTHILYNILYLPALAQHGCTMYFKDPMKCM